MRGVARARHDGELKERRRRDGAELHRGVDGLRDAHHQPDLARRLRHHVHPGRPLVLAPLAERGHAREEERHEDGGGDVGGDAHVADAQAAVHRCSGVRGGFRVLGSTSGRWRTQEVRENIRSPRVGEGGGGRAREVPEVDGHEEVEDVLALGLLDAEEGQGHVVRDADGDDEENLRGIFGARR